MRLDGMAQKNPPFSGFWWFHWTSLDGMKLEFGARSWTRTNDPLINSQINLVEKSNS